MMAGFSVLILLILSPYLGGLKKTLRTKKKKLHLLRSCFNIVITLGLVYTFSRLPLASAYSMIFTLPLMATLIAIPLNGETIGPRRLLSILIGFIGVLVILRPGTEAFDPFLLLPLFITVCIAFNFLLSKKLVGETFLSLAFFPHAAVLVVAFPVTVFMYQVPDIKHILLAVLGGGLVAFAMLTLSLAFQRGTAYTAGSLQYSQILWAVLFGWLIFGDGVDLWVLVGAMIIIGSGLYTLYRQSKSRKT